VGAITELVELVEKLDKSIKDRKCLDMLLPLKEKILAVQKEQFYLEKKNFEEINEVKSSHTKEMAELKSSYANKLSQLEKTITDLKDKITKSERKSSIGVAIQDPHIADILKKI
jgi:hypothetical protein